MLKELTEYIQESILSSTKTGKAKYPVWSKLYQHDQWEQAAKDFCKFYEISSKWVKKYVKDSFLKFVQKDIESFRFIQDFYIEEKMKENTNDSLDEIQSKVAFTSNRVHIYFIVKSDDNCWFWKNDIEEWQKIYYSPLSKYLLA